MNRDADAGPRSNFSRPKRGAGAKGGTGFVAFAIGMSDNPGEKMPWSGSIAGLVVGIALVLIGKFSGL